MKIMRNIGIAFVKLGAYQDAMTSFENIVETTSDYHAAFNLVICYFALGDRERMKRGFQKLLQLKPIIIEQFEDLGVNLAGSKTTIRENQIDDHDVFNEDNLRAVARERFVELIMLGKGLLNDISSWPQN